MCVHPPWQQLFLLYICSTTTSRRCYLTPYALCVDGALLALLCNVKKETETERDPYHCRIAKTALCQEILATDIGETMSQLTMDSLWGVFWIIYYGFIVSLVFLTFEWILSGMMAVDPYTPGVSSFLHW